MDTLNLLITGAGAPGAAGIIHCLRQEKSIRIFSADINPEASGKLLSDVFFTIPSAQSPEFIPEILKICMENNIQVIMPLVTRELLPFARARSLFQENNIQVLCATESALEKSVDKGKLYTFLQSKNIAVPEFVIAENIQEFLLSAKKLGYPEKEICFKPCLSNGSRGFRIVKSEIQELDLLLNTKPDNTYISLERAESILRSGIWPPLLVSEYLPGDEYSIDCVVQDGFDPLIVPRRRTRISQGISTAGVFENDADIIRYCREILEACELSGNIGIQVKRNIQGEARILEINPRVQGTISAGLGAGINLPLIAVYQALGRSVPDGMKAVKWGTRFVRVWQELFYA